MMSIVTVITKGFNLHSIKRSFCILMIFVVLMATIAGNVLLNLEENSVDTVNKNDLEPLPTSLTEEEDMKYDKSPRGTRGGAEEDIVLNEIMILPGEGGSWVEIYNSGNESVSVDNWLISDEDGLTYQLGNLPDMPPGSYIVVHFDHGESDTEFGQTQPNAMHIYTGWKNVRFTRHNVDSDEQAARVAVGYDIVTGGKPEVLVNKFNNGKFFYESKPDMSDEWIKSEIRDENNAVNIPSVVHRMKPIDIDADGVTDIVSIYCFITNPAYKRLYWIKSPPNPKNIWGGPYVIDDMEGLAGLDAGNINGDNLMDVIASQSNEPNHNIYWYESPANPTISPWPPNNRHNIDNNLIQPGGLVLVDLDEDGDLDIVAVGSWGEEVVWYEHPNNPAELTNPWPKWIIASPTGPPGPAPNPQLDAIGELIVRDLDDDQKLDVIVSESKQNRVVWYKYSTGPKDSWERYIIDDDILGPSGLDLGDIDRDGDLDVIVAATSDGIAWYPQPTPDQIYNPNWPRYFVNDDVIDSPLSLVLYVNATDLDNDGDLDIATADQSDGKVYWFENEFLNFTIQDQCALYKSSDMTSENIIDFVAWGGPALGEDDIAVNAGIWQADDFVDMTNATLNETIARDRYSQDNDLPEDWDVQCGIDSDIPMPGMVNYPCPMNIQLSIEYNPVVFMGGPSGADPPAGMPSGLCLANYSSYTFNINVSNPFGWSDLEWVELILDPNGTGIKLLWTQADNNFGLFNVSNYITIVLDECSALTDGIYTWLLNFTVIFDWLYPSEALQDVKVTSHNSRAYEDVDTYNGLYRVVTSLNFTGEMLVREKETGEVLQTNDWIIPGVELEITGPIVIYDVQNNQHYPADSQFNVLLQDNEGNSWTDYTSAGYSVNFTACVPNDASTGQYTLTLEITDIPEGCVGRGERSHELQIDAGSLQFDNPSPEGTVWHISSSTKCSVKITDDDSGVAGDTIEYRIANGSIERFGEWQQASLPGTNNIMEPEITYNFPEGPNNWIQWRAKDVAGNGPTSSPPYRVPVDYRGVSYHEFYPPPIYIQQDTVVTVHITIADYGGSGVNISTLRAAIKPAGEANYGNWFDPGFIIGNQTDLTSEEVPSGPETVRVSASIMGFWKGMDNYIKFRAQDMAENDFTESEEFNIHLDIQQPVVPVVSLVEPTNRDIVRTQYPKLRWQLQTLVAPIKLNYYVYISTNKSTLKMGGNLSEVLLKKLPGAAEELDFTDAGLPGLQPNTTYFWTVIPELDDGTETVIGSCNEGIWEFKIFLETSGVELNSNTTTIMLHPGDYTNLMIEIRNLGVAGDNFTLAVIATGELKVNLSNELLFLAFDEIKNLNINISAHEDHRYGIYNITIFAYAQSSSAKDSLILEVAMISYLPEETDTGRDLMDYLFWFLIIILVILIILTILHYIHWHRRSRESLEEEIPSEKESLEGETITEQDNQGGDRETSLPSKESEDENTEVNAEDSNK